MIPIRARWLMCAILIASPAIAADPIKWRTDYNAARKEATEKNLPLFVEVQTDQCIYCRKMEASTFVEPGIVNLVNANFIPLKIDGNKDRELAQALRVQLYPTVVLAGPDGKIHSFLQGYLTADQIRDPMKRTALAVATPDWIARDLELAGKAIAAAEYPKAVGLLNAIVSDGKSAAAVDKAKTILSEVETIAAQKLVVAKNREIVGDTAGATKALAELAKEFAGTRTAESATARLASLAGLPKAIQSTAVELLAQAREQYRTNQFAECLESCERLNLSFEKSAEAGEGQRLIASIQSDPDRLAAVIDRQNERTATLYLALAESWQKKGHTKEAQVCLEKVTRLCPNTRFATAAQTKLNALPGGPVATPASFKK
jgi:thioredoxin-like negative regulator of GroEL